MAIANTLKQYMMKQGVNYDVVNHPRTMTSVETARSAHIPGERIAKAVLLEDDQGYLMAVLPASNRLELGAVHRELHRPLGLATERELTEIFYDCETGAIPPTGSAYGVETILDSTLSGQPDVYFEAGDHEELIHVTGDQFRNLMGNIPRAYISTHL